ncbi:hybrid sensor histidine kinase/response regulator transcription factor [Arcticibacterium luteifluviistationis]|uniref:histidine kinase n=1 Tax=Arcticibacterium luteifluviistationis TaxID=1784714 RepID=A0A2Z4G9W6_9BACT|nr:response regulator [Arcticibacterium luteifluviistationis]AWV98029.1 hypothetical protein DJ013_07535 [Arcticibacterium luteifluviistationis]
MLNRILCPVHRLSFGVIFTICFISSSLVLSAQKLDISLKDISAQLELSEKYLNANKNDSVLIISKNVLIKLKANSQLNTDIGIRFQLVEALALEQKEYDGLALEKLSMIVGQSLDNELWDVYSRACLAEALIHEKSEQKDMCFEWLALAEETIKKNHLEKIYPYYAIRMASATRIFYSNDKAKYYLNEAIRSGREQKLLKEEALGHHLMYFILPEDSASQSREHWRQALELYKELKDDTGVSFCYGSISKTAYDAAAYNRALAYNDSSLYYTELAIKNGFVKHPGIGLFNVRRGEIFEKLGQKDSAIIYLEKGYELEVSRLKEKLSTDIFEIVSRHKLDKAEKAIDFQESKLQLLNILLFISILAIAFIVSLLYFLRKNNRNLILSEKKLQDQNKLILEQSSQLKTLDIAKSRFFANVSHELRTPLTLILGPINTLLKDGQMDKRQTSLLKMASRSGKELIHLVNEILDLGKLDSRKMKLKLKSTHLKSFFQTFFVQFESLTSQKSISYVILNSIDESAFGEIDETKCRQIVNNLVSNAIKYTPENGKVIIELKLENSELHLLVSNSGKEISQKDLPHIFERYYQGEDAKLGGTGIGLALCHEYVHLLKGQISAYHSEEGQTVFDVKFPLDTTQAVEPVEELLQTDLIEENFVLLPVEASPGIEKPTILLVEDNLSLQEYISMTLEQDYKIVKASNGQDALLKLTSIDKCSLILSDLMMPIMDGYELIENIKSNELTHNIPMIMLTARVDLEDKLKALRIGVDDYITKPFDQEELLVRIGNLLKNKTVRDQAILEEVSTGSNDINSENDWFNSFEDYVRGNCGNANLNIPEIAEEFAMSESTLLRQLKKRTGLTTIQFIQEVRLRKALLLLENGEFYSIKNLAAEVGYKDARTFSRSFKSKFGKLPTEMA